MKAEVQGMHDGEPSAPVQASTAQIDALQKQRGGLRVASGPAAMSVYTLSGGMHHGPFGRKSLGPNGP